MALSDLVKGVRDYFADEGIDVPVSMSEKDQYKNLLQGKPSNKVIFVPVGGSYGPARLNTNPRQLRMWNATAEVHVFGYADGYAQKGFSGQDELAHYEQTEILHNQVQRAIYNVAHGTYQLTNSSWTNTPTDKKYGKELVFTIELKVPIIDTPWEIAPQPIDSNVTNNSVFPQGYKFANPEMPGGFVGETDLDGNSTVSEVTIEQGCCDTCRD